MSSLLSSSLAPELSRSDKAYVFLSCFFVGILMLTNIIGTKLFVLAVPAPAQWIWGPSLVLTSGIISYPLTFLLTDMVSELWGKRRADLMVFIGFLLSLLMLLIISLAKALPPADIWQIGAQHADFFHPEHYIRNASGEILGVDSQAAQAAFSFSFEAPGLLLFASMLAYLSAQLLDNYLFHFWRRLTHGRHLWLRNNASTWVSQLIDTTIVNGIFLYFYWQMPWIETSTQKPVSILQVIFFTYTCKVLIACCDTPLIYLGSWTLRRFRIGNLRA